MLSKACPTRESNNLVVFQQRLRFPIALKHLVEEQQMATPALSPHLKDIVGVLLRVLQESESDDIPVPTAANAPSTSHHAP